MYLKDLYIRNILQKKEKYNKKIKMTQIVSFLCKQIELL